MIFVFSLENEDSFKTVHQYYSKMNHYRNLVDVPFVLVGTQGKRAMKGEQRDLSVFSSCLADAISESNPRVIHEDRAKKLANDLQRCPYYETCATYGLNVERVFHDG